MPASPPVRALRAASVASANAAMAGPARSAGIPPVPDSFEGYSDLPGYGRPFHSFYLLFGPLKAFFQADALDVPVLLRHDAQQVLQLVHLAGDVGVFFVAHWLSHRFSHRCLPAVPPGRVAAGRLSTLAGWFLSMPRLAVRSGAFRSNYGGFPAPLAARNSQLFDGAAVQFQHLRHQSPVEFLAHFIPVHHVGGQHLLLAEVVVNSDRGVQFSGALGRLASAGRRSTRMRSQLPASAGVFRFSF